MGVAPSTFGASNRLRESIGRERVDELDKDAHRLKHGKPFEAPAVDDDDSQQRPKPDQSQTDKTEEA